MKHCYCIEKEALKRIWNCGVECCWDAWLYMWIVGMGKNNNHEIGEIWSDTQGSESFFTATDFEHYHDKLVQRECFSFLQY